MKPLRQFLLSFLVFVSPAMAGDPFQMTLRTRTADDEGLSIKHKKEMWVPGETAFIVCDMWDSHHCLNATRRVGELGGPMNDFLHQVRDRGALVVHAPSSCMTFYEDHPARARTRKVPQASSFPEGISQWLNWIDSDEEKAGYPIDHSDGGEDDEPEAHKQWHDKLQGMGRDPKAPWVRQTPAIDIDPERDYITDDGKENWSILEHHGIKNVALLGVHTNMCVLGRPFGLRQMARNGKNTVLVRDFTDTMYNPAMPPKVSHFRGTDLIIGHVEKYVCATVVSNQITGGDPFVFRGERPHLVMVIGEKEYQTARSLPAFADSHLADRFRISIVQALPDDPNYFHDLDLVTSADLLLVSVRRRTPSEDQMRLIRNHVAAGRPVAGIRTASHAFTLRNKPAPDGMDDWKEFDAEVLGGNYHGHHGNDRKTTVWASPHGKDHPIMRGIDTGEFRSGGSLYQVSPLAPGTRVLMMGRADDLTPHEPVAWTFKTNGGGRVFYTSLGHVDDFKSEAFCKLLQNGILWAAGLE